MFVLRLRPPQSSTLHDTLFPYTSHVLSEKIAPKMASHDDEINLDPKLFELVKTIYNQRDTLDLDPVQKRLVERDYDNLVRAGAQLSDADKATMRKLTVAESTLSTKFQTMLVAAAAKGAVVVDAQARLDGLSKGDPADSERDAQTPDLDRTQLFPPQDTHHKPV